MALLLLLPGPVLAQAVHGTIVDPATGERVNLVEVGVLDRSGQSLYSTLSDANGEFELPVPPGGGLRLSFKALGYQPVTSKVLTVRRGEMLELEVQLVAAAVPLEPITVLAKRHADQRLMEFYQRASQNRRTGVGRIWSRADLVRTPRTRISGLLQTVISRSSCTQRAVYVDGVSLSMIPPTRLLLRPMPDRVQEVAGVSTPDEPATPPEGMDVVDWLVSQEAVEGIEVYRDAEIPAEYNPDGRLCQVTLIWRRAYSGSPGPSDFRMARIALVLVGVGAALGWLVSQIH